MKRLLLVATLVAFAGCGMTPPTVDKQPEIHLSGNTTAGDATQSEWVASGSENDEQIRLTDGYDANRSVSYCRKAPAGNCTRDSSDPGPDPAATSEEGQP